MFAPWTPWSTHFKIVYFPINPVGITKFVYRRLDRRARTDGDRLLDGGHRRGRAAAQHEAQEEVQADGRRPQHQRHHGHGGQGGNSIDILG